MLFIQGEFFSQAVADIRSRKVLNAASHFPAKIIDPGDLLAAVIQEGGHEIRVLFTSALHPRRLWEDLPLPDIDQEKQTGPAGERRRADGFSPSAKAALNEWETLLVDYQQEANAVALELLVLCLLRQFDRSLRQKWEALDFGALGDALEKRVSRLLGKPSSGETDGNQENERINEFSANIEILNLTRQARDMEGDHASPFDTEPDYEHFFDGLSRGLCRDTTRHVLVIAEKGVGVAALLAEFARKGIHGEADLLKEKTLLLLNCRQFAWFGAENVLHAALLPFKEEENVILCLEGLAGLFDPQAAGANLRLLLGLLQQFRGRVVGVVTQEEYEEFIANDVDAGEFFSVVQAPEPSVETAIKLTRRFSSGLQVKYDVVIDDEAIRQAVVLSANYILHERLPGKAVRILHRVCEDMDYARRRLGAERECVTPDDVVKAVSEATGVPEETLSGIAERSDFESSLAEEIFGQPHVIKEVAQELGLIKAGFADPSKPASVMLFIGQTGTGKTEMAKALARFYSASKRLRTYTLGNFIEPHSVSGLIGVPAGYVGHDQGGRLIADLNSDPYCVFLLDEADKPHPDVLQPFLNLFDEGWVRDQRGVQVFANKSIFILTTNVGQRMIADMAKQGKTPEEIAARMKEALGQIRHSKSNRPVFTPEFLARIKRVVVFMPLDEKAMEGICRKLARQTKEAWAEQRRKALEFPDSLLRYIAREAHQRNDRSQGREGGRIVKKLFSDLVEAKLQRAISERPDDYRACTAVSIQFEETEVKNGEETEQEPRVTVHFERTPANNVSGAAVLRDTTLTEDHALAASSIP